MVNNATLLGFATVALGMVLTPGPNMMYLISRSLCQGAKAGLISLGGVALGFVIYMLAAAFGVSALLITMPYVYDGLRFAAAGYLLYLAWQAFKPRGHALFDLRNLPSCSPKELFAMGCMTNLLNPKAAMLYLSLLPQFIDIHRDNVLGQSLVLGTVQIGISIMVNSMIIVTAGSIATFLAARPLWLTAQRWLMGTVLLGLAVYVMVHP